MSKETFKPRYKVGDMLKHKASGQLCIVVYVEDYAHEEDCVSYGVEVGVEDYKTLLGNRVAISYEPHTEPKPAGFAGAK